MNTKKQFEQVIVICRDLFEKKLEDYGASWRILRTQSVTDQIILKPVVFALWKRKEFAR